MEELHVAGRLPCKQETFQSGLGKEKAENMLKNGWNEKVIWEADTKCNVQSESNPNVSYRVDLARATCECLSSSMRGMCKHMHVALNISSMRGVKVDVIREKWPKIYLVITNMLRRTAWNILLCSTPPYLQLLPMVSNAHALPFHSEYIAFVNRWRGLLLTSIMKTDFTLKHLWLMTHLQLLHQ